MRCCQIIFVSAETLKACALIGLHLLAAGDDAGSSGGQFLDLGDMWKYCCALKALTGTATSSHGQKAKALFLLSSGANTTWNASALNAVGQDRSGEKISLFLEDWELARVALGCHIALDLLCQEVGLLLPRGLVSQQGMPFSHRGRAVTEREGCAERK